MDARKAVLVGSDTMGRGDDGLGATLMGSFLRKLLLTDPLPETIVFYTAGVKLPAEGSAVLDAVQALSSRGVDLVACGTCVGFFGLSDRIVAGRVGNMGEIAEILMRHEVVTI